MSNVGWTALLICLAASASNGAIADDMEPVLYTASPRDASASSNWDAMFHREEPRPLERFPEGIEEFLREYGGWYTQLHSTTVWQKASASKTDRDSLLNTVYNLAGAWSPRYDAFLSYWIRGGRPLGDPRNADLSTDIGSILDVNGSLESEAAYLREFYWAQGPTDHFIYTVGLIDASYRYDFNEAANDDTNHFLSSALINSATIDFPEPGYAIDGYWQPSENWGLHLGLYQGNCDDNDGLGCLDELTSKEYLAPIEWGYRLEVPGWGTGNYRILGFYKEDDGKKGGGLSISVDQQIGRFMPFLRASIGDPDIAEVERFFSAGVAWQPLLKRPDDVIGLGYATGSPADKNKPTEKLFELYWRFQLNPFVSVTPDIQWVFDPANNPDKDRVFVFGMRLNLDF